MPGFLSELGASNVLSREEAAWILIRQIAKGITESQITPYEGARFIAYEIVNVVWPNQQHPLRVFIGLGSDYEDCAAYPDGVNQRKMQIEENIISEAREILK
jgi:hypothetical protein